MRPLSPQLAALRARLTGGPARRLPRGVLAVVLVLLAVVPLLGFSVPGLMPGPPAPVNSAGTVQVLGLCLVFAGVAVGYDVLFGRTGLLSFGPALYFALGVYVFDIANSDWGWSPGPALLLTLASAIVLALALGSICLRVGGIAFAMVTLAFAQAGYFLAQSNPLGLTGGDTGLVLSSSRLPGFLVGVANTPNLYWMALGYLVVALLLAWWASSSAAGLVWTAIRDNQLRVEVMGYRPFPFKLASFVLSSVVSSAGGVVYLLLVGTAAPTSVASTSVTVSILVMVVLGGAGSLWGPALGAMVYVYLQQYLLGFSGLPAFASLPGPLRIPLSQPDFLLGAIFILFVIFVPGGLAGLAQRLPRRASHVKEAPS